MFSGMGLPKLEEGPRRVLCPTNVLKSRLRDLWFVLRGVGMEVLC